MTRTMRTRVVALGTAAVVTAANGSEGAYFSQSWGWIALAFLVPASLVLILGFASPPGRLRAAFALITGGLGAWIALSSIWSLSSASSIREAERMLVYVALAVAVALVLRRGDAAGLGGGVFIGVVLIASYALATRLFQDVFEMYDDPVLPYRLSEPLGYWNSLGLLTAIGLVVGLGFVALGKRTSHKIAAGIAMPVVAATLYFTFSRGAWVALGVGLVAMVALDARRLRLLWSALAIAPASIACVAVASQQEALTTEDAPVVDAVAEGHRLAFVVVAFALVSGVLAWGAARVSRRIVVPRRVVRAVNGALVALLAAVLLAAVLVRGGPSQALAELKERFDAPLAVRESDLNARLFSVSGNGRSESIRVAWAAARERRVLGHGAGSYEYLWYERRSSQLVIRDAHSLYAEVLAEIGVVGLALLCLALLVPVVAAVKARRLRFVPAAAGAYAAWVAHSAMDWHWEMVGVTLTALLAGGVALLASERRRPVALPAAVRWPLLCVSIALTVFALVSLVGNQALFAGREALARRDWQSAAEHGRRAQSLLVWSYEPELVLGDAAAGGGDRAVALGAYRDAAATDRQNWIVWLRLAQVARGAEREAAYVRVRRLNPRERDLPGASAGVSP